ncbi:unnamed protein product [Microthlaspi erraticum]|uniref:F-box domain-containing protein n=1 Tax=Microthlaspi erraticum TaxID=1685480 RepID=A0A6D2K1H2_9BRAS|nr:unnamed protein product [Microthlaspi erraticum]
MDCLTDDLCAIVLARLPLKTSTASKVVCKQWKSIVESPFFQDLYRSVLHQDSHSCSWSLMTFGIEIIAHYRCETWGLEHSLKFYVSSFLERFNNNNNKNNVRARVVAYSDVGLILIHVKPSKEKINGYFYVANPVSWESVEILFPDALPLGFGTSQDYPITGIVTRTDDKGLVLSYKLVLMDKTHIRQRKKSLNFLIYSSETGSWSLNTYHLPYSLFLHDHRHRLAISLNGNLHCLAWNRFKHDEIVSIDFYAGSDRCRVTPFPDSDKTTKFEKCCTPSQGFLMYMNIVSVTDGSLEDKLCLWRLQRDGWQLVSAISMCDCTCETTD